MTTASKRMKYLEINTLRKKKPQSENYKTLINETDDDTNKWKGIHIHRLERLTLFKGP